MHVATLGALIVALQKSSIVVATAFGKLICSSCSKKCALGNG
jgi:hypothetical protein